jgi:hypothetical protein
MQGEDNADVVAVLTADFFPILWRCRYRGDSTVATPPTSTNI